MMGPPRSGHEITAPTPLTKPRCDQPLPPPPSCFPALPSAFIVECKTNPLTHIDGLCPIPSVAANIRIGSSLCLSVSIFVLFYYFEILQRTPRRHWTPLPPTHDTTRPPNPPPTHPYPTLHPSPTPPTPNIGQVCPWVREMRFRGNPALAPHLSRSKFFFVAKTEI